MKMCAILNVVHIVHLFAIVMEQIAAVILNAVHIALLFVIVMELIVVVILNAGAVIVELFAAATERIAAVILNVKGVIVHMFAAATERIAAAMHNVARNVHPYVIVMEWIAAVILSAVEDIVDRCAVPITHVVVNIIKK